MEASQAVAVESLSYRWLVVNIKPAVEISGNSIRASFEAFEEASFIEMDPKMPPSKRFSTKYSQDFNLQFPLSPPPPPPSSSLSTALADQLSSNGYCIIPRTPLEASNPILNSKHVSGFAELRKSGKWRLPRLTIHKYLSFLRPFCRRFGQKSSSMLETFDGKSQSMKKLGFGSSPRISVAYSADDWRMSCDSECSIYEAVLHCKNSFGK